MLSKLFVLFSNGKGFEPLRLEEELDIHHLETLMFKFMTHIPDRVALKAWLAKRRSMYRDQSRIHSAGLMTLEEFHEMLTDLLGVETWEEKKVALFDKEIETLFKKVTTCMLYFIIVWPLHKNINFSFSSLKIFIIINNWIIV